MAEVLALIIVFIGLATMIYSNDGAVMAFGALITSIAFIVLIVLGCKNIEWL